MSEVGLNNDQHSTTTTKNSLKRPRPVISCLQCRRKKLKCDRTLPCQQCIKAKRADACSFQPGQEPELRSADGEEEFEEKRRRLSQQQPRNGHANDSPVAPSVSSFERLEQRVAYLENFIGITGSPQHRQQQGRAADTPLHHWSSATSRLSQNLPSDVFANASAFIKLWCTPQPSNNRAGKAADDLKVLHQSLKNLHRPPSFAHPIATHASMLRLIPAHPVCRVLSEVYFDNLEHCFRILHKPTFDRQMDAFFAGVDVEAQKAFLPQLVGMLAVASTLGIRQECIDVGHAYDGELVHTGAEFVESYLESLRAREGRTISTLQTRMLLLLLRWLRLDKLKDLWELSGQIMRQALAMGLGSDPSESENSFTLLEAELRRRLFTTIVEQDMMLSILANMPCLVPDFSCRPPLNVNDQELEQEWTPDSKPLSEWSDTLCQCYLAQSITERLNGCREIQKASRSSYNHILEHSRSLERCLQDLPAPLRFDHIGDVESKAPARLMARMELDITIRRPLMQIYSPFFFANDAADAFAEARAGFLQSCLMLTSYQDLFDPRYSEIDVLRPQGYWDFFWNVYRCELNQSVLGLCLEVQRLTLSSHPNEPVANHSFSAFKMPRYTRSSLIHAVIDILEPLIRRVTHLGSKMKDLAFFTIILSSVQSARYNDSNIIEALEDLRSKCRIQIERDGISIMPTTATNVEDWAPSFDIDTAWLTFPPTPSGFDDIGMDLDFENL